MQNNSHTPQPLPLPNGSSQRLASLLRPIIKWGLILILFLIMEVTLGHPAIRYQTRSSSDYDRESTMITVLLETHHVHGQAPLITFIEPNIKLSAIIVTKATSAKNWLVNRAQSALSAL